MSKGKNNDKLDEAARFAEAKRSIQETFDAFGVKKKGREVYKLTRSFMMSLFSGIASFIVLKSRQMAAIAKECAEAQVMIEELKHCTDPARINALLVMIEKVTDDDQIPNLAFGGSQAHNLAASYTDEWVSTLNGHFRHYYIC